MAHTRTKTFSALSLALALTGMAGTAKALMVAVDLDPSTAGIQNVLSVSPGESFTVDIVLSNPSLEGFTLQGFEFDLDFDPAVLSATSVYSGGYLQSAIGTFTVEEDILAPDVNFAEVALGDAWWGGYEGIFASISFDAIGAGTSLLSLNDVLLSDTTFLPVSTLTSDGTVTISSVPLPPSALLFGTAIAGFGFLRRLQRHVSHPH